MSYAKKLKQGSFRGAKFFVESSQETGGQRVKNHEFPLRDEPYAEPMGRKSRGFTMEIYVIEPAPSSDEAQVGLTYFDLRDKLIAALETSGPGTLVHPRRGNWQMQPGEYQLTESWKDGGKATFNVVFNEAGVLEEPDAGTNTQAVTAGAADVATAACLAGFSKKFSVLDQAKWLSDAAVSQLNGISKSMNAFSQLMTVPSAITNLVSATTTFSSSLTGLISAPSDLAASVVGIIALVPTLVDQPLAALGLYKHGLFNFGANDSFDAGTQAPDLQDAANAHAVNTLVVALAIIGYARTTATVPSTSSVSFPSAAQPQTVTGIEGYDSADAAIQALDALLDAIEGIIPTLDDDDTLNAIRDLGAAVMADLNARAASLPSLIEFKPLQTLPALVLAQIRYGDATRADEISMRNGLADPGFVAGGQVLELLNV